MPPISPNILHPPPFSCGQNESGVICPSSRFNRQNEMRENSIPQTIAQKTVSGTVPFFNEWVFAAISMIITANKAPTATYSPNAYILIPKISMITASSIRFIM